MMLSDVSFQVTKRIIGPLTTLGNTASGQVRWEQER